MSVNVYDPVNDTLTPVAGATLYADTPVGFIGAFDAEEVPDGWLIFNGQTVLRSDYPDLWARANRNNQVGVGKFYGIGDGSTTFTLADLRETSLKGYGETSRTVGAHVKSGGLAVGEFIDDRKQVIAADGLIVQMTADSSNLSVNYTGVTPDSRGKEIPITDAMNQGRTGPTTEVKAVGVVWAVKAKQVGLPIDLKQQVENELFSMLDHRNIFRGRCLNGDKNTLYPTTPFPDAPKFTGLGYSMAEILAMITDGSFRDIWTGDYFIDFNDSNRVYRIVDLDAYYNRGNRTVVNKHHIVVVPDYAMDNTQWNSSGNTSGGYPSSTIRSVMEGASVQGKIESFFGSSNLIPMEALLSTGESNWAWSQDFSGWTPKTLPMTEVEVYGSSVFGNGFQTGTGCSQLAGFRLEPRLAVGMRYDYWLMSISSSSLACLVADEGRADYGDVTSSLGCRPRVLIG